MANESNNLVILKNGLSRTIGATDDVSISGGLNSTSIGITAAAQGKFTSAEVTGDLTVGGDIVSGGTSDMLISDNFIDMNHGLRTQTNTAGGFTVNLAASANNSLVISAYTASAGGNDSFVTMTGALVRAQATTTVIATAVAVVGDTLKFTMADGALITLTAVAAGANATQFNVGADAAAQTDAIKAAIDAMAGTPYATTQAGGAGTVVTVTATAGDDLADGHSINGTSILLTQVGGGSTFAITSAAFAGGAGLSKGDIVQVSDVEGADASNNGVFQISGIPSTTQVNFARSGTVNTQVPFCQNQLETQAAGAGVSGFLSGLDLSALAFSEGTLTDVAGAAISKGLLCQAFSLQANVRNWAWESAGNVSLQEAYGVGPSITVGAADLVFNATNSATGDIQITAPGGDALFVDGSADSLTLGSAGVGISFGGSGSNKLVFDDGMGITSAVATATQNLAIGGVGTGGGALTQTLTLASDNVSMTGTVDMDLTLTTDASLAAAELKISSKNLDASKFNSMSLDTEAVLSMKAQWLDFTCNGRTIGGGGVSAGRITKWSGNLAIVQADAAGLNGVTLAGVAVVDKAAAAIGENREVHGSLAPMGIISAHAISYVTIADFAALAGKAFTIDSVALTEGVDWAKGANANAAATALAAAINGVGSTPYEAIAVSNVVHIRVNAAMDNGVTMAVTVGGALTIPSGTISVVGGDAGTQSAIAPAVGNQLYLSSSNSMAAFYGAGWATSSAAAFGTNDTVMRVGIVADATVDAANGHTYKCSWSPQFIANIA